jgi:ADP-ribosylglycohydrolase
VDPLARARRALDGLSVGDAFGQRFFIDEREAEERIAARALPLAPWTYTDDTEMAIAVVETLAAHGMIDRDALAARFAARYTADPRRGYGGTAHEILQAIAEGTPWRTAAGAAFGGMGSMGNGGAMRVAPLGAYFADDLGAVVAQARASAEVTHAHEEGQAGAIAIAVAAAYACRSGEAGGLLPFVLDHMPDSETRAHITRAHALPPGASVRLAASALGTGNRLTSQDTVPFALWCAARHLGDYVEAMWTTVAGLGDRDTTCAIVGGIVALAAEVPREWIKARENVELAVGGNSLTRPSDSAESASSTSSRGM